MSPWSYPRDGTWGCFGSNSFFPNMVVWHIKLKGMMSRTGYKLTFHCMVKLVILGVVNRSIIIKFLRERGVLAMAPIDYAITSTLIFLDISKFGDCCSIAHLASPLHQ